MSTAAACWVAEALGCATPPNRENGNKMPDVSATQGSELATEAEHGTSAPRTVDEYLVEHTVPESAVMRAIAEETRASTDAAMMMVGPVNAALLRLLVQLLGAKRVVEVGTFTGYSAIAMAEGLPSDGKLTTCDISKEWTAIAKRHWATSPHGNKIELKLAPALETLPTLKGPFDMAFIDADKANYPGYWDAIVPKIRRGGLVVVDNVLWGGSVLNPDNDGGRRMDAFNRHASADKRLARLMVPVRDGVTIARKL